MLVVTAWRLDAARLVTAVAEPASPNRTLRGTVMSSGFSRSSVVACSVQRSMKVLSPVVQMTSSRVRLGQSFKTVGCGCTSCWGDVGAGSVEADVFYIPFIVSVQYIV